MFGSPTKVSTASLEMFAFNNRMQDYAVIGINLQS